MVIYPCLRSSAFIPSDLVLTRLVSFLQHLSSARQIDLSVQSHDVTASVRVRTFIVMSSDTTSFLPFSIGS